MRQFTTNRTIPIFILIMVLGIFLRTYHFHDFLDFKSDQVRDAKIVSDVIHGLTPWPSLGPTMGGSATAANDGFRIGPIYYSFQIISAEIFGNQPDRLAYPDLLFSILTMPVFYLFLKRYFSRNISLGISGLYAISYFPIRYAHFAWNSNSIPLFVLLLLLSLYEFGKDKERTPWVWVTVMGIALGIGVQLHAIPMVLFSIVTGVVLLSSLFFSHKKFETGKRIVIVFIIFLILNSVQIVHEMKTDFVNSKIFLTYLSRNDSEHNQSETTATNLWKSVGCHLEGNFYMLSSLGEDSCSSYLLRLVSADKSKSFQRDLADPFFVARLISGALLSIFGYTLLFHAFWKEQGDRKKFLGVIILYAAFSFVIMFPIFKGKIELRYFSVTFFMPFLFIGLFIKYLHEKISDKNLTAILTGLLFLSIVAANSMTLKDTYEESRDKVRIGSNQVVLGEIEPVADYIITSAGSKKVILNGDSVAMAYLYNPLVYLAQQRGVDLTRSVQPENPMIGDFYISTKSINASDSSCATFGQIYVCRFGQ